MSFITKRERVFNEYDLFELPPRNEGKLKAYASCTDARAWSHFCSDKTEHLVEIIKRNNDICRTKYVPTDVIVETLMVAKNAEISRLKHKIEEFEQMLAAYDQLDLTSDQKGEIASAHAAIKAANKELDELCLDLDLSGFTEGVDSDAFETGKSRGDEPSRLRGNEIMMSKGSESAKSRGDDWSFGEKETTPRMETKSNQAGMSCHCDATTNAHDPRIQEMQDSIITKDAKLCAMQNTIAVMENDVCEPYCIYAHIYTALEKIFGVLCQNDKYKLYLSLMTAGKDTRCIDIKGKILFKLKVLEKFSLALIAPCSQEMRDSTQDCACLRAEVVARLDFLSLPDDDKNPSLDSKRAQLVADIMENEEMKELLNKDSATDKHNEEQTEDGFDTYSIDNENLRRLKNLQENYDDLMTCYEKIKHERDSLQSKCHKYEQLETEFDNLKSQLREYNVLWTEREHYRKRSSEIDSLKEQYLILADETSNLETQLKAEAEISHMKSITIEDLRNENIALEKKINEILISYEKEKNTLQCKLKETECTIMCQDQQIKSLSLQIDRLLEQSQDKTEQQEDPSHSLILLDEIESLKQQIKNLKDTLYCSEDEKQHLQDDFEDKLKIINDLKMEIEDWKSTYEKTVQRNEYLEKYAENEVHKLIEENQTLSQDLQEKSEAVANLISVINNKSQEIKKLSEEIEQKDTEQKMLYNQVEELRSYYHHNITAVKDEKQKAFESLQLARQESRELLQKIKDYNEVLHQNDNMPNSLKFEFKDNDKITDQNETLQKGISASENNNSVLLQEIERLREEHSSAMNNILSDLQHQKDEHNASLELTRRESKTLENKLLEETNFLKDAYKHVAEENEKIKIELMNKKFELESALKSLQLRKKDSEELINKLDQAKIWEEELANFKKLHNELMNEKRVLQSELSDKSKNIDNLLSCLNDKNKLFLKNSQKVEALENELIELKKSHDELLREKTILQTDFDDKTIELNHLYNTLETKIEENTKLLEKIKIIETSQKITHNDIVALQNEHLITQTTLSAIQKESAELIDKLKEFESLRNEYDKLKMENECMQIELGEKISLFNKIKKENQDLCAQNQNLQDINEDLEKSLINTRKQLIEKPGNLTISFEDVLKELEDMKKEKLLNHNKIKDLLNRLDESDNIISNLREDIWARDDKVSILENHINDLEDEIRKLRNSFVHAVDVGESIKNNSFIQMDQSLKAMEAHQSKAAHNMKMDLAKLQNENSQLEHQLSVTKLKTEESSRDKNKYLSQVIHLQNEREVLVSDIKQLELKSVGDSKLSPDQCKLDDILSSLDRIKKSIEAKSSKSICLEQTILKVQTSSQLLLTKADTAKKLVEKEKQKIIMEKEDAIRDRLSMEKRVEELKNKLDEQINNDTRKIKDLEANILNQKLLNEHTTSKLKEEIRVLQSSNENSVLALSALQEKFDLLNEENEKYNKTIEKLTSDLDARNLDKEALQNKLEEFCNKPVRHSGTQANLLNDYKNVSSQTESVKIYDFQNSFQYLQPDVASINNTNKNLEKNIQPLAQTNFKVAENKQVSNLLPKRNTHSINEVQILTANVEPSFDFVRNSYLNYKIQRLSPGRLEQYSISNMDFPENPMHVENHDGLENKNDLIDVYNRSIHSISSKIIDNDGPNTASARTEQSPTKSSVFTGLNYVGSADSEKKEKKRNNVKDSLFIGTSQESADSDLFVIYKESKSDYGDKKNDKRIPLTKMHQADIIDESVSDPHIKNKKVRTKSQTKNKPDYQENDVHFAKEKKENDIVKPKLKINLPRVRNDSPSIIATSEGDKKSIDSYRIGIYSSPRQNSFTDLKLTRGLDLKNLQQESPSLPTISNGENQYLDSYSIGLNSDDDVDFVQGPNINQIIQDLPLKSDKRRTILKNQISDNDKKACNQDSINDISHHRLSRVGADVYLMRSHSSDLKTINQHEINSKLDARGKSQKNFGLGYILDSVQREVGLDGTKTLNDIRKTKSDDKLLLDNTIDESSPSRCSPLKVSSLEYKTISSPSRSYSINKLSNITQSKSVVERCVMTNMADFNDYESKIKHLTKALENTERDYKRKLDAIKVQYDMNIKNILTEHNIGVKNIQGLHEETLQDIIKFHENEIENLRSMSIEANRKAEKLEKENRSLKSRIQDYSSTTGLEEEPTKISSDTKKRRRSRIDTKLLTKTNVEAYNVKPKSKSYGPCTCSLDANVSDTIRNIFEQVDVDQRKMAEHTYVKYIANKILGGNVEALDAQELSFLHLKVCRTWKTKLTKEEALQKRIDSLESELMHKQRHAQQHIAELDRKVAEERRRLQEVREAVCRSPPRSRTVSPQPVSRLVAPPTNSAAEKDLMCNCNTATCNLELRERRSAGDLAAGVTGGLKQKRPRTDINKADKTKTEGDERRERKIYSDEAPTRLRRTHDRPPLRFHKK